MSESHDQDELGDDLDTCQECDGAGGYHDCGEDSCCCADPGGDEDHDWFICAECNGTGVAP
jgi:hypothetical protein